MTTEKIDSFIGLMNQYGALGEPFLFIIDFDIKNPEIHKLNSIPSGIKISTPFYSNIKADQINPQPLSLKKYPLSFNNYLKAFTNIQKNIISGNSYLLNLTFPTMVETNSSLDEIFHRSHAKYKLIYHDMFVVFSPETFIRISNGEIKSYPMKGTINATVPNAERVILNDKKEIAEHCTIVDLIRNDLAIVSENVQVTKLRYIERIRTGEGEILQVSSEITGKLREGYNKKLGDIITSILPAGSVTGAPKKETVRIIKDSEQYDRGWYTGVFGIFDGQNLDSAVMIRFIEKNENGYIYKSGGGITFLSDPEKEYDELISKVYVPAG